MSLDIIKQHIQALQDMSRTYASLENQHDEASETKKNQMRKYMLSLARNIQRALDEERQNAT